MKALASVLLVVALSFCATSSFAQPSASTWALSNQTLTTATNTGSVVGSNQGLGVGPAPAIAIFDYNSSGQRLWTPNTGWVAGPEEATRYIQFDATPASGSTFTVTGVSFDYGAAGIAGHIVSNAYYSTDGWATRTQLNSMALAYPESAMLPFSQSLSVPVTGASFSVRIHPYALLNSVATSPTFATHRNVVISGVTTSGDSCDYLCNMDFEEFENATPTGSYHWYDQNQIPCWNTTAIGGDIEIWRSGFQTVPAFTGNYFAELNGTSVSTLFQSLNAVAGNVVEISFAHRGRYAGQDSMTVSIGPVDANGTFVTLGRYGDNNTAWGFYTETYVFPVTGPMELRFNSISSNDGAGPSDGGNFLDAISISCPSGICGVKFDDADGDGERGVNEPGLPNWEINLTGGAAGGMSTMTDANGAYCFTGLPAGMYTVAEVNQAGWLQTAPAAPGTHSVILESGPNSDTFNFGNQREPDSDCAFPPEGMVGWWSGDGNTLDTSGFGNNGTLVGGASYVAGHVGDAFDFTSVGDYASVPDAPSLNFGAGQDFSIDFWVRTTDPANWATANFTNSPIIMEKFLMTATTQNGWIVRILFGHIHFQVTAPGFSVTVNSSYQIDDGNWHFVAITMDRSGGAQGGKIYIDDNPVQFFDVTLVQGSLANTSTLTIGQQILPTGPNNVLRAFGGQVDEVEIFTRELTGDEVASIYNAGIKGKCKDPVEASCDETARVLPLNSGLDYTYGSIYAIGGNDAFWMITADADTSRTVPRPAEVITHVTGIWPAAPASSQWIGPSQIVPHNNSVGLEQNDVGLGSYQYSLELCIVDDTAEQLTFNLLLQADNSAWVWLRLPGGTRLFVGATGPNGFSSATTISTILIGPFVPGTYVLEVDVHNNGISPDFTGMNLTGSITGANLFLQKHECCNSSGKLTGTKFSDANGNGVNDSEAGLTGVVIELLQNGVVVAQTTTDGAGEYFFDVAPGTYTVREVVPMGYAQTSPAAGTYTVTVGPGGIVSNLDFGNQVIPCIGAKTAFLCKDAGGRYIQLIFTNNGPMPVGGVSITSLTPGVTFTLTSTPTYPIAIGGMETLNIDFTGLAPGASAQMLISTRGPVNEFGVSEACCAETLTVVRPGGPGVAIQFCPPVVIGGGVSVLVGGGAAEPPFPVGGWVIRMVDHEGRNTTTTTDETGYFLEEGLPFGTYMVSVDLRFGAMVVEPSSGYFLLRLIERQRSEDQDHDADDLRFVIADEATHTDTEGSASIPTEYAIHANYPNPFNPTTLIQYGLPESGHVRLEVFDMLGRHVSTLVDGVQAAGQYRVTFDAGNLASGMYLYRLSAGSYVETRRMSLVK